MMRNKDRFYWSDKLYLARVKNELMPAEQKPDSIMYICNGCGALIRFEVSDADRHTGRWLRLKPYEHYQILKRYHLDELPAMKLEFVEAYKHPARELYQCKICASYWWKEQEDWERADDEAVEND